MLHIQSNRSAVQPITHVLKSSHGCVPRHGYHPNISLRLIPRPVFDKIKQLLGQASSPMQAEEENTMKRLDAETQGLDGSEQAFGPAAVLLVGFSAEEVDAFRAMMLSMEADMFKIIPATRSMLDGTLQEALSCEACPSWEQPPLGTRRAIVLSGMYGGEVVEVISAYREAGLPSAVFAAAVPNNMNRQLRGLLAEVTAEDIAMKRMAEQRAREQEQEQ